MAFLSDHQLILGCGDGTVRLWDLNPGVCRQVFYGHKGPVLSVAIVGDPLRIVSAGDDGTVRLWNPETCLPERVIHRQEEAASRIAPNRGRSWIVFGKSRSKSPAERDLRNESAAGFRDCCPKEHRQRVFVEWMPDFLWNI